MQAKDLQQSPQSGGAKSGAVSVEAVFSMLAALSPEDRAWMREDILKAGVHHSGSWAWFRDAACTERASAIGYEVNTLADPPWVRLFYTFTERQDRLDYRMELVTTRPRFGGQRWWFICPLLVYGGLCGRRLGKLYLPPGGLYYGCRHCYQLTYTSCQESRRYAGLYRHLAAKMGLDFATVKRAMNRIGKR